MRVLFVCLGNICRSPSAEVVMKAKISHWETDSAGIGSWHLGRAPDPRAQAEAAKRGYDLSPLRARQVNPLDFENFDRIYVMDQSNKRDVEALRPAGNTTPVLLFLGSEDLPDPYYDNSFSKMFDLIEARAEVLADYKD